MLRRATDQELSVCLTVEGLVGFIFFLLSPIVVVSFLFILTPMYRRADQDIRCRLVSADCSLLFCLLYGFIYIYPQSEREFVSSSSKMSSRQQQRDSVVDQSFIFGWFQSSAPFHHQHHHLFNVAYVTEQLYTFSLHSLRHDLILQSLSMCSSLQLLTIEK